MAAPTTLRGRMAQFRQSQANIQAYRGSTAYAARRTAAIMQRGLDRVASGAATPAPFTPLPLPTIPSSSTAGCNTILVSAGISCAQQAANRARGLPAHGVSQGAPSTPIHHNAGASSFTPIPFPTIPGASGYPTGARFTPRVAGLGSRLAAMRAQMQGYVAAGAARQGYPPAYAPTYPGSYTAGGYQTTGPDTTAMTAPPATAPAPTQPAPTQQPPQQPPQGPAPTTDPRQALQVFQQSRTARGLPTVSGVEYLPSVDALAQQLLASGDPDSRGALPYTLGHVYQVISEQAVRLGDLGLAQVYASLAARYPAPPAMAGFGAFQVGGVSLGGWALTAAVALGAAVGLLAVRDARRPAGRSRPHRRNGRRRAARR